MSADNLVYIRRFGQNEFKYIELTGDVDIGTLNDIPISRFGNMSYPTPLDARQAAIDNIHIIEYGFFYSDDCFVTE